MATVETVDVTTKYGSDTFPVNVNDFLNIVEPLAIQNIRNVKSANRINDAFYEYEVENGKVIEEAIIKMAEKQNYVNTGAPNLAPKDPTVAVKYFNDWEEHQYQTTTRIAEIRKIIANKGTGVEEVVSQIIDTLTQGEGYDDYKEMRDIIADENVGFDASTVLFGGKVPKNMKGVIYCLREMYNSLKATNTVGIDDQVSFKQATPVDDIRIAISESVLNLIDVVELANIFNLSKEELFGKLVVIPYDVEFPAKVVVYDRKALGRGTRLFEFSQDYIGKGLYTNHYLTVSRIYLYNALYKCLTLDISDAIDTAKDDLLAEKKTPSTLEAIETNDVLSAIKFDLSKGSELETLFPTFTYGNDGAVLMGGSGDVALTVVKDGDEYYMLLVEHNDITPLYATASGTVADITFTQGWNIESDTLSLANETTVEGTQFDGWNGVIIGK